MSDSCDPMDCSPPGSSVHGISQARIQQWVSITSSRESSWPRDQACISCIGRYSLYHWATKEVQWGQILGLLPIIGWRQVMICLTAGPRGLLGLLPACWWVGLNPGPSGVWDCVQRGQEGSGGPELLQPAAGRGCVFAWLAAWPGGSQDWFWQIGGWGRVLALRSLRDSSVMSPASAYVLRVEWVPPNCCRLCLCFQEETQLLPASPGILPKSSSGSDTEAFEVTASSLIKKKKKERKKVKILCVPFKSSLFFLQPSGFPKCKPWWPS